MVHQKSERKECSRCLRLERKRCSYSNKKLIEMRILLGFFYCWSTWGHLCHSE